MDEKLLLLTGRLAEPMLRRVIAALPAGTPPCEVRVLGVQVAALMTTALIERRLGDVGDATRVILPGLCRGPLEPLIERFGVPFERGPEDLKDLPQYLGGPARRPALTRYDIRIFAEIVDAPLAPVEAIVERALRYRADGADVIDLGFLPDTPFPHLEEAIAALHGQGLQVSADTLDPAQLRRAAAAGADYLLSLTPQTLPIAFETDAVPVVIPPAGELDAAYLGAIERLLAAGRPLLADPVLEPIHHGFTRSLLRYQALRDRYPELPMMMGTGNLTELSHADTAGANLLLLGVCSELGVQAILTTEVSGHCRSVVRECDLARRILYAARADGAAPRHYHEGLMTVHERHPFPLDATEIAELAARVRDPSYRIQVSEEGIHLYNRAGLERAHDPFALLPAIDVGDDTAHAFYLGVELARAEIAWQLGKRYRQDRPLEWGCAARRPPADDDDTDPAPPLP